VIFLVNANSNSDDLQAARDQGAAEATLGNATPTPSGRLHAASRRRTPPQRRARHRERRPGRRQRTGRRDAPTPPPRRPHRDDPRPSRDPRAGGSAHGAMTS
jgi:hypothetical protein